MEWLVGKGIIDIYNCQPGIDMYDAGYEANHMADINDCGVGCCPTGSERLTRVPKNHVSRETM